MFQPSRIGAGLVQPSTVAMENGPVWKIMMLIIVNDG